MKNRIIKFRAWDKDHMERNVCACYKNLDKKEITLMQYTGLKDKNGKEIYEEDIVKDKDGLLFVVGWGEDTAQFSTYPLDKDNDDHRERFNGEQSDDFEIIGNIYKNKDLIK